MARPKKQPAERRTVSLSCRLTMAERLLIETAAAQAGLSLCEYVRRQVLKGKVSIQQNRALDHSTFDQLRRIGVNLNQLTRLAHQTGEIPPQISRAAAAVERVIRREIDAEPGAATDDDPGESDGA